MYLSAVDEAFGADIDYSMLITLYGEPSSSLEAAHRYSSSECGGTRKNKLTGNSDPKHVSTSYVERANLTMRMAMRRFTRLTNAFSKKLENHAHMVALYALWYNFVRVHKSLRTSPAMAAGIETRLWSMEDVVRLIEQREDLKVGRANGRLEGDQMDSSFALMHWFVVITLFICLFMAALYVVIGIPAAHILHRTGNSRWWSLLIVIPIVNVIGFWIFAFTRWPAVDPPEAP